MAIQEFTGEEIHIISIIFCGFISGFFGSLLFRLIRGYFINNSPRRQQIQSFKDLGVKYITGKSNIYKHLNYVYTEFNNKIQYYDKHGNRVKPEFDEKSIQRK